MSLAQFKSKDDTNGVRVPITPDGKTALYIRRVSNQDYQNALNKLMKAARPKEDPDAKYAGSEEDPTAALLAAVLDAIPVGERMKLAAKHILVGWENLEDDFGDFPEYCEADSKRIRYSEEASLALLTHPRYRNLYDRVMTIAGDAAVFREQRMEEDLGNSGDAFGGGLKTPND